MMLLDGRSLSIKKPSTCNSVLIFALTSICTAILTYFGAPSPTPEAIDNSVNQIPVFGTPYLYDDSAMFYAFKGEVV
jgi:hypothetical protein